MRTVLIVDDEKNIRNGLKAMIEREFPDQYQIRIAMQGAEALEIFQQEPAEIVITDIRMPVLDGIQLIERLTETTAASETDKPIVIILSGYEDFEYAKAAIRYRVLDYLLKPIRREELFTALRKSEEELSRRDHVAARIASTESYRLKLELSRLQELLLQGKMSSEEADGWAREIGFDQYQTPFAAAVLNYRYENGRRMPGEELKALAEHMLESVGGHLNAAVFDPYGRVVLIGGPRQRLIEMSVLAEEKDMGGLLIGISEEGSSVQDVVKCYAQAGKALDYAFVALPNVRLILYSELPPHLKYYPVPEEEIRKLGNILGTNRGREIESLLQSIFHLDAISEMDISYLETVSKKMNENVLDEVFRVYGESSVEILKLYRKVGSLNNFLHFHDYYRSLQQLLLKLNDYIEKIRSAHSEHGDMKDAVAYIEENSHRPLNMAMVSNYVSLNYSYFSEAFKAYTGVSFVVYLKKVRIRKAKELIATNKMKLSEIGIIVGFENSKQFTRVFKELEGISPMEYRTKLSCQAADGQM